MSVPTQYLRDWEEYISEEDTPANILKTIDGLIELSDLEGFQIYDNEEAYYLYESLSNVNENVSLSELGKEDGVLYQVFPPQKPAKTVEDLGDLL